MRRLAPVLPLALAILLIPGSAARADFGPCPGAQAVATSCETLTVPLDRSGGLPGDVHLFVERRGPAQPGDGALVVLAGGPGQAATPLIDQLQQMLAPALANRDLVVFDQRGTGASDPLQCPQLDSAVGQAQNDAAVTACANGLGPGRAFYTSRDSADDIDAVRQSLGVDKISLYGVSYGTYTALTYARRYPGHVESLLLDSVINPNGRDPLDRNTFLAFPRVLRDICGGGCSGITRNPVADLGRLAARVRRKPVKAHVFLQNGRRLSGSIGEDDLQNVLEAGDLDPTARAEIPSSIASALKGDPAPLARLLVREQLTSGDQVAPATTPAENEAVFLATSCEELALPWSRTAPLSTRPAALASALAQVPASVYAPFDRKVEMDDGTSRPCLTWPDASPTSPMVTGPAPNVPVLLLEGVDDTRTTIADAQAAANLFPQAQLVTVPQTGHSVLGTDLSSCSSSAVTSFFSGAPVRGCVAGSPPFPPTPLAPTSLSRLHAARGVRGKRGRTVTAVARTLSDSVREATGYALNNVPIAAGGLRGGHLSGSITGSVLTLHLSNVVYVPGVRVSGTLQVDLASSRPGSAKLRVSGSAAAAGSLSFAGGAFTGRLDKRAVHSRGSAAAAGYRRSRISPQALTRVRRRAAVGETAP